MTVEVLEPEPMQSGRRPLAQQMAEKAYDSTKVNMEESVPVAFRRHWTGILGNKRPVSYHPIDLGITKSELTPNAPNVINSKVYPLSPTTQKVLTSTWRTT